MAAKETTRYTDFNRPHALVDNRIRSQFNANFPFNKVGVLPLVSYFYPACILKKHWFGPHSCRDSSLIVIPWAEINDSCRLYGPTSQCENSRPSSLPVRVVRAVSEEGRFQLTVSLAMSNSFKPLLCHSSKLPLSDVFFRKGRLQPLLFHPTPIRVLFLPEFLKYLSIDFQLSL